MSTHMLSLSIGLSILGFFASVVGCSNDTAETSQVNAGVALNPRLIVSCSGRSMTIPLAQNTLRQSLNINIPKPADLILSPSCSVSLVQESGDPSIQWLTIPGELYRSIPGAAAVSANNGVLSIAGGFYTTHRMATAAVPATPSPGLKLPQQVPQQAPQQNTGPVAPPTMQPPVLQNPGKVPPAPPSAPATKPLPAPVPKPLPIPAPAPAPQAPAAPGFDMCPAGSTCNSGWGWIPANNTSCRAGSRGWVVGKNGCSCRC